MKIKPENYPVILIAAFVIGIVIAMALGFRPSHGSSERESSHGKGTFNSQFVVSVWAVDCNE